MAEVEQKVTHVVERYAMAVTTVNPIDCAPKDGTCILGYARRGGWREVWFHADQYDGAGWMDHFDSEPEPTHWLPLPIMPDDSK